MGTLADKEWLSPNDVGRVFGVSRFTVVRYIKKFKTARRDERGNWLIHRDDVIEQFNKQNLGRHGRVE